MQPMPIGQSCQAALAARRSAITSDVNAAYDNATQAWNMQGEGNNGYAAEQPCGTNTAISICQWAQDDQSIDVDQCITCTDGSLGIVFGDYSLTVSVVGSGTVTQSPNQQEYSRGTLVTLTASAAPGWHFVSWSGDGFGSSSSLVLTMNSSKAVTATFAQDVSNGVRVGGLR